MDQQDYWRDIRRFLTGFIIGTALIALATILNIDPIS